MSTYNKSDFLPVANATKPFWLSQEESDPISTYKSSETVPEKTDILIIGAGYCGTSVAYNLFKENPDLDVTLVEARNVCSGATGRNGGHMKPYTHREYYDYAKAYGEEVAAHVVNFEVDHLYAIKKIIEEEEIDCEFILTRACDVYTDEKRLQNDIYSYKKFLENPFIREEVKESVQLVQGDHVETLSKFPNAKACFTYPAGHLWPWKLITGLLKKTIDKGLKLYTNTPVTEVTKDDKTGNFIVKTSNGTTIAKKVIFCTNAYTKSILEPFGDKILPFKGIVAHIKPEETPIPQLPNTYCIFGEYDFNFDYLINRADGSVVVGGSDHLSLRPDGTGLLDCADDSFCADEGKEYFEGYMNKTYTTWKDTKTTTDYLWSGIMGFSKDEFPYVGEMDFLGMKNGYIAAGFSGHGMPRVYLSGKAIAECVLKGISIQEQAKIPACYHLTPERFYEGKHAIQEQLKVFMEKVYKKK